MFFAKKLVEDHKYSWENSFNDWSTNFSNDVANGSKSTAIFFDILIFINSTLMVWYLNLH